MALVLSVVALKGGVGKSTVALNVGSCLHRSGHRTLLVDADSQGTLRAWAAKGAEAGWDGPPVIGLDGPALRRDLERVAAGFDLAIIDGPPRLGSETRAAMLVADFVLMPVTPGAADVWALRDTLALLEDARSMRPELAAAIVLNRADRTTLAALTKSAIGSMGVPVLEASFGARVVYGEATLAGKAVVDYAPDSPARLEVEAVTAAALKAMGGVNGQERRVG
jgi:chromosome partitioning protein